MSPPVWEQPGNGWQQPTPGGGGWQQPGGSPPPPPAGGGWQRPPPDPGSPPPPGSYSPYGNYQPGYQPWYRPGAGQLAGWWRRVGATLVDDLFVGFALTILLLLVGAAVPDSNTASQTQNILVGVLVVLGLVGAAYYYVALVAVSGRTLGNRMVGTRVVDARTGQMPGWGKAAAHFFMRLLMLVFAPAFIVDILWPLWDERRQTLHDKVAGTLVVTT